MADFGSAGDEGAGPLGSVATALKNEKHETCGARLELPARYAAL